MHVAYAYKRKISVIEIPIVDTYLQSLISGLTDKKVRAFKIMCKLLSATDLKLDDKDNCFMYL